MAKRKRKQEVLKRSVETDSEMNHSLCVAESPLSARIAYLQGCVLAALVDDGEVLKNEKDFLECVCNTLNLGIRELDGCVEIVSLLDDENRKSLVFEVIEMLAPYNLKYSFVSDVELIFSLKGKISKGAKLWVEFYKKGLCDKKDWRLSAWQAEQRTYNEVYHSLSFSRYKSVASQGDGESSYIVGNCFEIGYGVTKNIEIAVKWYEKAGAAGIVEAQYLAGHIYAVENLEHPDKEEKADKWLTKAADNGHSLAMKELNEFKVFVAQRKKEQNVREESDARRHVKEAIHQLRETLEWFPSVSLIVYWFVFFVIFGIAGFLKGILGIIIWSVIYRVLRQLILAQIKTNLQDAEAHDEKFKEEDAKKAFIDYKEKANQGDADAQFHLGDCYEYGKGCQCDSEKAKYWYNEAASQGHDDAIETLKHFDFRSDWRRQQFLEKMKPSGMQRFIDGITDMFS